MRIHADPDLKHWRRKKPSTSVNKRSFWLNPFFSEVKWYSRLKYRISCFKSPSCMRIRTGSRLSGHWGPKIQKNQEKFHIFFKTLFCLYYNFWTSSIEDFSIPRYRELKSIKKIHTNFLNFTAKKIYFCNENGLDSQSTLNKKGWFPEPEHKIQKNSGP